ncbi:mitochondrial ribosome-associated GTPase 1 isoform X2 [Hypanus sabinus]|uniref:mitochondrial ribosome-associated GTPase 1 isoform X2 n=1 Tax=Hypanus sabinus TaxID=79690 RepID=UPI0028C41C8C|nr:mitochondrial ribosome-associated GTPase 1 isoform X2 [Hypanus sabinus]
MSGRAAWAALQLRQTFDLANRDVARWFPGHMAKGLKKMQASLKKVDCIIEVHDARIPLSGCNPIFKETLNIRPHLLVLNKMDIADLTDKQRILKQLEEQGVQNVLFTNCLQDRDVHIKQIVPTVVDLIQKSNRYHRTENMEYCLMVIGVPNVGKSSLINAMRRMYLKKGTILDHLVGEEVIADYLLFSLNKHQKFDYVERYQLGEPCDDLQTVLKKIAVKLGKTQKVKAITGVGNVNILMPNYSAAAYDFIRTFRKGDLGKVMLD